ncbi:MAG: glycosyltransferase family 4 protein [Sporichthyaceae bacterium]|nr:glycosyltransferase family 4 protein [Sporichthyaceae bacterium]
MTAPPAGRALRVGLVASEYPPYVYGGLGTHVEALTAALAERSVQVELFVPTRVGYKQPPPGVRLRLVPARPPGSAESNAEFWVDFCAATLAYLDRLGIEIDLVHCHDWLAVLAGVGVQARRRVPLVFSVHLPQVAHPHAELELLGLAAAEVSIVNSDAMRRELGERDPSLPPAVVIPNGVDSSRFHAGPVGSAGPGRADDDLAVLFVGRLVPEKGADVLLRAFAAVRSRMPHARLVIVGDGDQALYLRRLARYFGLAREVEFTGWLTGDELVRAYRLAAVVAVPSRYEPFGLVALEAMSCARPVVASRIGGLAEIIKHETTGLLVPTADHLALAQGLVRLLTDDRARDAAGQAARSRALDYPWPAVAAATERQYVSVLQPSNGRDPRAVRAVRAAIDDLMPALSSRTRVIAATILREL